MPYETDLSTLPPTATADGALYGFGLTIGEGRDNRFSAFDPEDALASRTRLLGLTALDLAAGEEVTAQRLEREPAAEWETSLHLEVDTPDGACTLAQDPHGDEFTDEMSEPEVEGDRAFVDVRATRTRIDCADTALGLDVAGRLRPAPALL